MTKVTKHHGTLFCEDCEPYAESMEAFGLVGPGGTFSRACPHIELIWHSWFEEERAKYPPDLGKLWVSALSIFVLGLSLGVLFSDMLRSF